MDTFGKVRIPGHWEVTHNSETLLRAHVDWRWLGIERLPKVEERLVVVGLANPETGKVVGGLVSYVANTGLGEWRQIDIEHLVNAKDLRRWLSQTDPLAMAQIVWAARGMFQDLHGRLI